MNFLKGFFGMGPSINYVGSMGGGGSAKSLFLPILKAVLPTKGGGEVEKMKKFCLLSLWMLPKY